MYRAHQLESKLEETQNNQTQIQLLERIADEYWSARDFQNSLTNCNRAINLGANTHRIHSIRAAALDNLHRADESKKARLLATNLYFRTKKETGKASSIKPQR
ncbi:MAG: hypothetical protein K2Z81_17025 [Cyanobacteria bacterium]|nr:hypothetical protein [Cyanobacteriota bacterium]